FILRPDPQNVLAIDKRERQGQFAAIQRGYDERLQVIVHEMQEPEAATRLRGADPYRSIRPDRHTLQHIDRLSTACVGDSGRKPGLRLAGVPAHESVVRDYPEIAGCVLAELARVRNRHTIRGAMTDRVVSLHLAQGTLLVCDMRAGEPDLTLAILRDRHDP